MIPGLPAWSDQTEPAPFIFPVRTTPDLTVGKHAGYSIGPVNKSDTSEGLIQRYWAVSWLDGVVYLFRENDEKTGWANTGFLLSLEVEPDTLSVCFDQSGRPLVTYTIGNNAYLWWYDPNQSSSVILTITGALNAVLFLDYPFTSTGVQNQYDSDVNVFYVKEDGFLYYRVQRERFAVENKSVEVGVGQEVYIGGYSQNRRVVLGLRAPRSIS